MADRVSGRRVGRRDEETEGGKDKQGVGRTEDRRTEGAKGEDGRREGSGKDRTAERAAEEP